MSQDKPATMIKDEAACKKEMTDIALYITGESVKGIQSRKSLN